MKIVTNSIIVPFSFQMEAAMVRMWGNTVVKNGYHSHKTSTDVIQLCVI